MSVMQEPSQKRPSPDLFKHHAREVYLTMLEVLSGIEYHNSPHFKQELYALIASSGRKPLVKTAMHGLVQVAGGERPATAPWIEDARDDD